MIYIDKIMNVALNYHQKILDIVDLDDDLLNNIYRARIEKIIKNQRMAFVNLGEEQGFLELAKNSPLKEQDEVLLQVKKIKGDDKYVELSEEISLEGKAMIFFPERTFVKYSKKMTSEQKNRLWKLAREKNLRGVLFRSKALEEDILGEYSSLKKLSQDILSERGRRPTPKLLYKRDKLQSFLKAHESEKMITNDEDVYRAYKGDFDIQWDKNFRIIYNPQILKDYKDLFSKKIPLEEGGNIVIEQTEALCSIDINSSGYRSTLSNEEQIYHINKRAAEKIAEQVMLRNISGIIIVDALNMKSEKNNVNLLEDYRRFFKGDRVFSKVHGYTSLGLIEISRENRGYKLIDKLGEER
ncbi:MAG: ribonuclease E/G [Peptoniphilus sp.]|nr:ribonuclease E/G [Peptoniphilus sp.]